MSERPSAEMEIYSGANERPDYLFRFPDSVTDEEIAEFEEFHLAVRKSRPDGQQRVRSHDLLQPWPSATTASTTEDKLRRAIRSYRIGMVLCFISAACALIAVVF